MGATVNLVTKFSDKVAERIAKKSITAGYAGNDYKFTGVKTLEVASVDVVALANYNRSSTSGYGTPSELGDTVQSFSMSQDKAFTYKIDKGNEAEQLNIKKANSTLQREIDEVIVPTLDKYRLEQWARHAGAVQVINAAAINVNGIVGQITDSTEILDNFLVPDGAVRTLFIKTSFYKLLKQNPDFAGADEMLKEAVLRGQVGEIDGMKVVKVPSSYFPAGVNWMIGYKPALLAPEKLMDYKIHVDPPGISGNLVEGRIMHDAFVLGAKGNSVLVCVDNAYNIATPTVTLDANNTKYNFATAATGADVYYTTDGSDPRYSKSAVSLGANAGSVNYATLNAAATDSNGHINIRAAAIPNSNAALFWSNVSNVVTYT